MAKMLYEIVKRNPDVDLVSLRSLPATGLAQSLTAGLSAGGLLLVSARNRDHGVRSYLRMLTYVNQLERLPAKIMWGNMELQAAAYRGHAQDDALYAEPGKNLAAHLTLG